MKSTVTVYIVDRIPKNPHFQQATAGPCHIEFPGGEVQTEVSRQWAKQSYVDALIDLRFADADGLIVALSYADALRRVGFKTIHLFCPYLPAARQDRYEEGRSLSAKLYADLINGGGFASVICVDPHSDVMPALLNNCVRIPIEDVFPGWKLNATNKDVQPFPGPTDAVLVCPDQGATKRTEAVAAKFGYNVVYARKKRDPKTGHLSGFQCDPIPPIQSAIIVDDICDGGGTFVGLAETINLQWDVARYGDPKLYLWTTHGIYSKHLTFLRPLFAEIVCTDSVPHPEDRFVGEDTLTIVPLLDTLKTVFTKGLV